MLTGYISKPTYQKKNQGQVQQRSCEISRLLSAAVINKGFRDLLLSDPAQALTQGYFGEEFSFDYDQKALILSIRADSLKDFALQITSAREKDTAGASGAWVPVNQPAFALHAK